MKSLYLTKSILAFLIPFAACLVARAQSSTVYFDLDACNAILATGDEMDYSEFTAEINNDTCATMDVVGDHLYRLNPTVNKHSCTPGVGGPPAMCIGSNPSCTFTPGAEQALRIDIMVSPGTSGNATLSELSFYEKGPTTYVWISGASGPNNYPTRYGVRVLKNGTQIFLST